MNKKSQSTAIYRTKDNISNFKFSIRLKSENSLIKLPQFGADVKATTERNTDETFVTIGWQQKILSSCEIELYKDLGNCTTDTQKTYHEWIAADMPTLDHKLRIYTYTADDAFNPAESDESGLDEEFVGMFVFVELEPDVLLFSAKWNRKECLLVVYPDFNDEHCPYYLEVDKDYRRLYTYSIENMSKLRETHRCEELTLPHVPIWDETRAEQFDMPPKRSVRLSYLVEIVDLQNFEYDNIHVRYRIKLPARTKLEDGRLEGSTHSSQCTADGWHLGHTFQLLVICDESFKCEQSMEIFFEIISIDSWERERLEGYAHTQIPLKKDTAKCRLTTFRLREDLTGQLRRFFIGGRQQFDVEKFFETASGNSFLNRLGTNMTTSGVLQIKYQSVLQRGPEIVTRYKESDTNSGLTLDYIMRAYREATRRLQAVSLDPDDDE